MHLFNILFNLYKKLIALINPIITISQAQTVLERFWSSPKVTQQESSNSNLSDPNSLLNHSAILFTWIIIKGTDDYSRKLVLFIETLHLPLSGGKKRIREITCRTVQNLLLREWRELKFQYVHVEYKWEA